MKIFFAFLGFVTSAIATPVPQLEDEFRAPWNTFEFGIIFPTREHGKSSESLFVLRKNNRLTFYKSTTDLYGKVHFSSGRNITEENLSDIERDVLNIWYSTTSKPLSNDSSKTWLFIQFHSNGLYSTSTTLSNPASISAFSEWMRHLYQ